MNNPGTTSCIMRSEGNSDEEKYREISLSFEFSPVDANGGIEWQN